MVDGSAVEGCLLKNNSELKRPSQLSYNFMAI